MTLCHKIIAISLVCTSCSAQLSSTPIADADVESFCALTSEIDELYAAKNDQRLAPEAAQRIKDNVAALRPLIPDDYLDDYRLRYWPNTRVSGDTSGTAAQAAYGRMRHLTGRTC